MKKQKHDFQVCFVDRVLDIEKIVEDKDSQFTKRSTKVANEQFSDNMKEKKTDGTGGKETVGTNFENILCRSEKERIRSMCNKTIYYIRFL